MDAPLVIERISIRRYAAVLCATLLTLTGCSTDGNPGRPVRISVSTPTLAPPGQHYHMPSACLLATSHSKSLIKGRLQIKSNESGAQRAHCLALTTLRGDDRSTASVAVIAWPTSSWALNSITSDIKSGKCKEINNIADSACTETSNGQVHVNVVRGNIFVLSVFRLSGLTRDSSKISAYAQQYARTISQSIR